MKKPLPRKRLKRNPDDLPYVVERPSKSLVVEHGDQGLVWFWNKVIPNLRNRYDFFSPYADEQLLEVIKAELQTYMGDEISAAYITRLAYCETYDERTKAEQRELCEETIRYLKCWEIYPHKITRVSPKTGVKYKVWGYNIKQFKKAFAAVLG